MGLRCGHNVGVGGLVNAERLLAEQVFPGLYNVHIQLLVQVVGNGAVDRLDIGRVQQFCIVPRGDLNAVKGTCEPVEHSGVGITDA